ncbi:hypothetical protein V8E54_001008 [Elaphomyces granulatus]
MSQVANTFCSFSGIVEAILYGSDYTEVPILSKPDLFTVCLSFYNPLGIEFMVSSVLYCQGTLTVLESGSLLPILSVRASSLITIGTCPSALFTSDDAAIPSQNATVSFVAKVIATSSTDGCRFFTTLMTAFKQSENNERVYETFHVICLMAPDSRWERVRFPSINNYAQVMGDVIGFTISGDIKCFYSNISEASLYPSATGSASTATTSITSISSPEEPIFLCHRSRAYSIAPLLIPASFYALVTDADTVLASFPGPRGEPVEEEVNNEAREVNYHDPFDWHQLGISCHLSGLHYLQYKILFFKFPPLM